jgi:Effector Associated Constant Component 1
LVDIRISISGEDDQESLLSFYEWLMDDRDIRTTADIDLVEARPQPGSMAGEIELISLLVSSGFNIASLAVAIAGWWATRTAPLPVRIEVNSVQIIVDDTEPETIEKIIKVLSAAQEDEESRRDGRGRDAGRS